MSHEIAKLTPTTVSGGSIFTNPEKYENARVICKMLVQSSLIPQAYRQNPADIMVALEMANRMEISPLMVIQNLNIIQGRPSFGSAFLIATVNTCGRYTPLDYEVKELGEKTIKYHVWEGEKPNRKKVEKTMKINDVEFVAVAKDKATGKELRGPRVTIEMAVHEGWYTKNDSKWTTMPDLMGRYRAAAFWIRTHAPEMSMGMRTAEELMDIEVVDLETAKTKTKASAAEKLNVQKPEADEYVEHEDVEHDDEIVPEHDEPDGAEHEIQEGNDLI